MISITLSLGEVVVEVTLDEAKELYRELNQLFGEKTSVPGIRRSWMTPVIYPGPVGEGSVILEYE